MKWTRARYTNTMKKGEVGCVMDSRIFILVKKIGKRSLRRLRLYDTEAREDLCLYNPTTKKQTVVVPDPTPWYPAEKTPLIPRQRCIDLGML